MMKRIAFITDLHLDDEVSAKAGVNSRVNFENVLLDVQQRQLQHIIFGGDLGEPSALPWLFSAVKHFTVHVMLGNHDHFSEVKKYFTQGNEQELYYHYDEDEYRFIFMDSSQERVSDRQLEWLEEIVEANKKTLLFIHHPLIPVNTSVDRLYPLKNRERLLQLLEKSNGDITIFCGHCHTADERSTGRIKQIMTHAVSVQVRKDAPALEFDSSFFGYRIIHLTSPGVETELITLHTS